MLKILPLILTVSGAAQAAAPVTSHWDSQKVLSIPAAFPASAQANGSAARLQLSATRGDSITCDYTKSGTRFVLSACHGPRQEPLFRGAAFEWFGFALPNSLAAGDQVIADNASLTLPACPKNAVCSALTAADVLGAAPADACESTVTANVHLLGDLACSTSGFALRFQATAKHFDGYGHSIKAPGAMVGLFVSGAKLHVARVNVSGVANGIGLQAYNTSGLVIEDGVFRNNTTGVNVYSDGLSPEHVVILRNDISNNSWVGLRFNGDNGFAAVNPYLRANDLSGSGYYALWLDVKSAYLDGRHRNRFDGSANGVYFLNGDVTVNHLDLSKAKIRSTGLFFSGNRSVRVLHSNASFTVPGTANQDRIGVHLYRVGSARLRDVTVTNADVGVKVATDSSVATALTVTHSKIGGTALAAFMVQSYDGSGLGRFVAEHNDFRGNPAGMVFWLVGSTTIAPSSVFSNNLQ